jgi:hypothetical protein
MTLTYNPIQERVDVPRRWFGSSLTPPELGTALVLVRTAAEPIVIWHGMPLPTFRIGAHRRYAIDVANHGLSFQMRAASSNPVFKFAVTVELLCRVLNPYTIARDNIHDMTAALMPSLSREVRDTAARFDVLAPTEAARAIEQRLSSARQSPDVELTSYSVSVEPENTQGVVEAKQELTVQHLRRTELKEVAEGSPEQQIAQLLAINNGDIREVLDYIANDRDHDDAVKLQALKIAMGGQMEDMDVADVQRNAFSSIFGGNGNGNRRESLREKLERRNKGLIEGVQVVDSAAPKPDGAAKPDGAQKPAERPAPEPSGNNEATPSDGA